MPDNSKTPITDAAFIANAASTGTRCPVCEEENPSYNSAVHVEGALAFQEAHCAACDHVWNEVYKLDGYTSLRDAGGNEIEWPDLEPPAADAQPAQPRIITVVDVDGQINVEDVPPGYTVWLERLDRVIVGIAAAYQVRNKNGYIDEDGDFWWQEEIESVTAGLQVPAEQAPATSAPPICVTVTGGVVEAVDHIPPGVKVEVWDYDTDGRAVEDDEPPLDKDPDGREHFTDVFDGDTGGPPRARPVLCEDEVACPHCGHRAKVVAWDNGDDRAVTCRSCEGNYAVRLEFYPRMEAYRPEACAAGREAHGEKA